MILSLCTISFRHQLISIDQLAEWAQFNHFQGIELWGAHAKNLASQAHYNQQWLASFGLRATMISDYLPLDASDEHLQIEVIKLCHLAKHWGSKKIRTFAGTQASANTSVADQQVLITKLRKVCAWLSEYDLTLIIEIHPNTFADTVESTQMLIDQVGCYNLKINFDVLHVWESKANIIEALETLKPHINHVHLKNVSSADLLDVFAPDRVYAAAGSREGIVALFDGVVDYKSFLNYVNQHPDDNIRNVEASLEWFGNHSKEILTRDRYLIQQLQQRPVAHMVDHTEMASRI